MLLMIYGRMPVVAVTATHMTSAALLHIIPFAELSVQQRLLDLGLTNSWAECRLPLLRQVPYQVPSDLVTPSEGGTFLEVQA